MKISITTHMPDLGIYFIEEIAKNHDIEYVIIQKTINKCSKISTIYNYFINKIKNNFYKNNLDIKSKTLDELASKYKFRYIYTCNINTDEMVYDIISKLTSGYLCVLGGKIIKEDIIKTFNGIWINGHGGVLPYYRGLCSEYWAIYNKDYDNIGSTIHVLTSKIDMGEILSINKIKFNPNEYLFITEARNHINLIKTYIKVIDQLNKYQNDLLEFDTKHAKYYSCPKKYSIKRILKVKYV